MAKTDYYEVLGVDKEASDDTIKKAYRKKSMKYHPDQNEGDKKAEDKFKEAAEAYEILSSKEKKQMYDQFGFAGLDSSQQRRPSGFNPFDIFGSSFEGMFNSGFNQGPGFGGFKQRTARGKNVNLRIAIPLEMVFNKRKLEINIPRNEECTHCSGTGLSEDGREVICPACQGRGKVGSGNGFFQIMHTCPQCKGRKTVILNPCPKCHGNKVLLKNNKMKIDLPSGIESDSNLRIQGEGHQIPNGIPGDVLLNIIVKNDEFFDREGRDLYCKLYIPFLIATFGGHTDLSHLDGKKLKIKVSKGTQSGDTVRLKGAGINNGSLYVELLISTPIDLDKTKINALKSLLPKEDSSLKKIN